MAQRTAFISYRRDDAAGFSHIIHDRMVEHLPRGRVFMDTYGIEPGDDFPKKLQTAVGKCDVLIVLIGARWAAVDAAGKSRLDDPQDWVRAEVADGLRRGIRLIPVLLDGARMPDASTLPDELKPLVRINALDLRGSRMNADLWDLTGAAMLALGEKWPPEEPGSKLYAIAAGLYAFFAGGVLLLVLIAAMFVSVPGATIFAMLLLLLNALVVLRMPIHSWVRGLTRHQALRVGAVGHVVGFVIAMFGGETEAGMVVLFGIIPALGLFLASFAMRRLVHQQLAK